MNIKRNYTGIPHGFLLAVCMLLSCGLGWEYVVVPNVLLSLLIIKKRKCIMPDRTALIITLIILSSVASICFTMGDKQDAIHEFLIILCFILAFFTGKIINDKTILKSLLFVGTALAVVGIMAYCNLIRIDELTFNDRKILRLQSFVKYANTTALILGCSYYAFLGEVQSADKMYLPYVGSCILLAMFLTISKAEIPLFILIGTVLALKNRDITGLFVVQNCICGIFAVILIYLVGCHYNGFALLCAFLCIIISGKINPDLIGNKRILIYIWITVIFLGVAGVIIISNIYEFDLFSTMSKRFEYMRDAAALLKDNRIFGIGSGAWRFCQHGIQKTEYSVTYLHNGWLQFWLENGLLFIVSFLYLFLLGLWSSIKNRKHVITAIFILTALHSLVDINFSFGIILMLVGFLSGSSIESADKNKIYNVALCGVMILSMCFNFYSGYEFLLRKGFEKAYADKEHEKAYKYAQRLEFICPYDSLIKVDIAILDSTKAKNSLELATKLSPYNKDIAADYISYLVDFNYTDINYIDLFDNYVSLAPKQEKTYTFIKNLSRKAYKKNLCTLQDYNIIKSNTEKRRLTENVVDRNELLIKTADKD